MLRKIINILSVCYLWTHTTHVTGKTLTISCFVCNIWQHLPVVLANVFVWKKCFPTTATNIKLKRQVDVMIIMWALHETYKNPQYMCNMTFPCLQMWLRIIQTCKFICRLWYLLFLSSFHSPLLYSCQISHHEIYFLAIHDYDLVCYMLTDRHIPET